MVPLWRTAGSPIMPDPMPGERRDGLTDDGEVQNGLWVAGGGEGTRRNGPSISMPSRPSMCEKVDQVRRARKPAASCRQAGVTAGRYLAYSLDQKVGGLPHSRGTDDKI